MARESEQGGACLRREGSTAWWGTRRRDTSDAARRSATGGIRAWRLDDACRGRIGNRGRSRPTTRRPTPSTSGPRRHGRGIPGHQRVRRRRDAAGLKWFRFQSYRPPTTFTKVNICFGGWFGLERAAKFRIYSAPFTIHNGFDQDFEHLALKI
jgi:hypothetical protein